MGSLFIILTLEYLRCCCVVGDNIGGGSPLVRSTRRMCADHGWGCRAYRLASSISERCAYRLASNVSQQRIGTSDEEEESEIPHPGPFPTLWTGVFAHLEPLKK